MSWLRDLAASVLSSRARYMAGGDTYAGARNVDTALGYKTDLTIADYRKRYYRNPVAKRIVEVYPRSTWRGKVVEVWDLVDNPNTITPFEEEWMRFARKHKVWPTFQKADIIGGLGHYSVILIGAPGKYETELPKSLTGRTDPILFLQPYAEDDIEILEVDLTEGSARYGEPLFYNLKRQPQNTASTNAKTTIPFAKKIHWSRVILLAEGANEDRFHGIPRLQPVWNRLDDLDKVVGGGAEAAWRRADPGYQFNIDPNIRVTPEEKEQMREEIDDFIHNYKKVIRTRGVTMTTQNASVTNFGPNADSIINQICSGISVPKRLLIGSEQGEMASTQDRNNWAERVKDRRTEYAGPFVVDQLIQRLIDYNYLPKPKDDTWEVQWPQAADMSDDERIDSGKKMAETNSSMGGTPDRDVLTPDEIRELAYGLPAMKTRPKAVELQVAAPGADPAAEPVAPVATPKEEVANAPAA